jgi:hypothetical protein
LNDHVRVAGLRQIRRTARRGAIRRPKTAQGRQWSIAIDRFRRPRLLRARGFYLIADEETNQNLQINQAQYDHMLTSAKKLEEKLPGVKVMPTAAKMHRKVYKRAFLGNELLQSAMHRSRAASAGPASPASSTATRATGSA